MKKTALFLLVCCLVCSCKQTHTPVQMETEYDYGFITRYGPYYTEQGIENNVYMLDIYTPGLRLNEQEKIKGTGLNLCFSDIFCQAGSTQLEDGVTYEADSTGRVGTYLPGQDFEGNVNGAYLLDIRDSKVSSIKLVTSGTFVMTHSGDTAHIAFELVLDEKTVYKATYHAPLPYKRKM